MTEEKKDASTIDDQLTESKDRAPGEKNREALKEEYEEKEKALRAKIFALEYENRELGYQLSIANEQKLAQTTRKKNEIAEVAELKLKYEEIIKSNEALTSQIIDLKQRSEDKQVKHEKELSKKGLELKALTDENKKLKKKCNMVIADKKELEEVVLQQEQMIGELQDQMSTIKKNIEEKEREIRESQKAIEQLNSTIENHKKTISSLQKKAKSPIVAPIDTLNLQNQIKALKKENEQKDNKISVLQMNNKILNSKITKAVPLNLAKNNNSNGQNIPQYQQQPKSNQPIDVNRAESAVENIPKKRLEKPQSKEKNAKAAPNKSSHPINFYESDPVYYEPSIKLDDEISDFLKKPLNDYKVLQPSKKNPEDTHPIHFNENQKEIGDSQVEFPIIESYSILKSQSEMFDKDDSKVEELQSMVKKILDDF